ncbi:MAG: beta-propeller fold lactonase family protein [Bacteroidota bacterium]|nr:beta-propeller fold lactonase family protein [Bacteroidota bacterium]MDP3147387.1 beta-propeller fold lactonase family protein [Bacteroidota bacterium]
MKGSRNIGINGLAQSLKKIFSEKKKSGEENFVSKTYGETEDSFFEEANKNLRTVLNLDKKSESYEKDLKRFGTRIKVIDVADDAIPNKRFKEVLPLKRPAKPTNERYNEKYEKDLKRFGTHQGVINVSNDDPAKRKKKKPFPTDFSKAVYKAMMSRWKPREVTPFSVNPYSDIFRAFPKAQVTVQNKSTEEKEVVLWGANQSVGVSPPAPGDVQDHTIVAQISTPAGVHPQGIVVNPANQLVYIANQLSGTITVLDSGNQVVKVIQLQPTFPGFTSPVALAVNTKSTSSKYGFVYVVCSVANTLAVIDLALNVTAIIPVGIRPVAVAFNPVNLLVYVANLASDNLSVIDAEALTEILISPLPTGQDPIGVGVDPISGDIYVANSLANSITVYDSTNALVTTIPAVGQRPVSVTYNPANNSMYAVATDNNFVYQINSLTHTIVGSIVTGNKPYNSFFDSYNGFLYVQNREDNTFTIIRPDNSKIDGLSFGEQNIGGAFNSFNNSIYVSDTSNNTINVIGYLQVSSTISINSDYAEMREDLQSNPAVIQHAKFVVTGLERLNSFRVNKFTPTGSIKSKPISFELYASPQSKLNVAEVTELAGTVIDGKMNWRFKLPGLHTVSILIWYRQFEVREILSPTNHK